MSNGDSGSATEHANLVLSVIQDDIRHVQLRATAALAVAAIFVTQIELKDLRGLPSAWDWVTVGGMALLVAAGLTYFHYSQLLNQARLAIAKDLPRPASLAATVASHWETPFMSSPASSATNALGWYTAGQVCFTGGALALFAVVAKLILS